MQTITSPKRSRSEGKRRPWVLAQRWLSRTNCTCAFHSFHKAPEPGWVPNQWCDKKPHKTSKHTDQTSGKKEVRYAQEWVQFPTERLHGHPKLPVMCPALGTRLGHRPSNTVYYCYDALHIEIFKLKSASIINEIHCLKYCTNHKSQVNCYILQISQDVTVVMSLSVIYSKYFV